METLTLPIGFRFVDSNQIYEVVEDKGICEECAFKSNKGCVCPRHFYSLDCSAATRCDNTNVSFKKIGYLIQQI